MKKTCENNDECQCENEPTLGGKDTCTPKHLQGKVMGRDEVYDLINEERNYQDKKNFEYNDSLWAINDWVVFIERYLKEIKDWTGHPKIQMDAMRKVAALAVACMEHNKTRPRNGGFQK